MKLPANVVGDSNDENNFPRKFLLTNTQVSKLRKAFANNSSANIKLSKTQLHIIGQSGEFLSWLFEPLPKTDLPLMENVLKLLAKTVLTSLGLTAAALARETDIQKKMFGLGITTIIISNEENNDIVKIVNSLEEFHLLIKGVSKTIVYEAEEQKWGYLAILLGTLGASLLGNMWR